MSLIKIAEEQKKKMTQTVFDYLKENYPTDCLQWVKDAKWSLQKSVPLSDIKMAKRPGGAREMDKVKGIAQAVKDGKPMEPVVLTKLPDGTLKIADGYHRTLGFKHAGEDSIKAYVGEVTEKNGPWDKEMHEKKLNVGMPKKAFVSGLLNIGKRFGAGLLGTGKKKATQELANIKNISATHQQGVKSFDAAQRSYYDTAHKLDPNWRSSEKTLRMTQESQKISDTTNKINDQVRAAEKNLKQKTMDQRLARGTAGIGLTAVGTQQAMQEQQQKKDQQLLDNMPQPQMPTPYVPPQMEPGFNQQANEVGFGLIKIAEKTQQEKDVQDMKTVGGLGIVGAGAHVANKGVDKVTGMERLYHGTDKANAKGILENGLQADKAASGAASKKVELAAQLGDEVKGKTYATRSPLSATEYALQQGASHNTDLSALRDNPLASINPKAISEAKILKAKIPYEDLQNGTLKEVANPELHGLTRKEWVGEKLGVPFLDASPEFMQRIRSGQAYDTLSAPNVLTVQGDLPSRYFTGAADYHGGQTMHGLANYIKNNPMRFAGGLGTVGAGVGLSGLGAKYIHDVRSE